MAFTGTFDDVLDAGSTAAIDTVANKSLDGILDVVFTTIMYVMNFLLQPSVILAAVALGLIIYFYKWGTSAVKAKLSGGSSV